MCTYAIGKLCFYIYIVGVLILSVSIILNYNSVFTDKTFDYSGYSLMEVLFIYFSFNFILFTLAFISFWVCILMAFRMNLLI